MEWRSRDILIKNEMNKKLVNRKVASSRRADYQAFMPQKHDNNNLNKD